MALSFQEKISGDKPLPASQNFQPFLDQMGQLMVGYRGAKALFVAAELDLFRHLDETDGTVAAIARRAVATQRPIAVLLDALSAIGFIRKANGRYSNTDFSRAFLHPSGDHSMANNLRYQEFLSEAYAGLTDTVRRGKPKEGLGELLGRRPDFVRDYIRGMADIARGPAAELAAALDLSGAKNLLDVGGGPGTFTLALLSRYPDLRATILDLPETLIFTREFVKSSPAEKRVLLQASDYHKAMFGREEYDLVLLSHVTHDESERENRELLRKAYAALRPGGRAVVHDFMLDEDRTAPVFGALFSLQLVAYTASGQIYSENDYRRWLRETGFSSVAKEKLNKGLPNETRVLVAIKGDGNERNFQKNG